MDEHFKRGVDGFLSLCARVVSRQLDPKQVIGRKDSQGQVHDRGLRLPRKVRLGLLFHHQAIDNQKDNGTHGGDEDAAEVKGLDFPESNEGAEVTADQAAHDSDDGGDDASAGVFARHDEFSECAGDEAEEDPRDDAHRFEFYLVKGEGGL